MEVQIKTAVKAGNSSAVILPRSWLDKDVRVELVKKNDETILLDVINIAKRYTELREIIGVYLVGSYARKEEDENSDIDILIITNDIDKEMISEGVYNILIISSKLLKQKLDEDLLPIGQMIKEAIPLLNSGYLSSIEIKVTKKNVKWYIDTTEDKLKIIKKALKIAKNSNKKYISDIVAYTLVLRIRTLYIIKKLMENKEYSKKDFVNLIKKISKGVNAYERYLAVKNNLNDERAVSIKEAEELCEYLENQLTYVKNSL
ncbi:hypothetical protein COU56_03785 [Candidatus Pacearchaeota archaeon CG10_big_fil_rev_8_21_14_0_10_31_9]|nr:MAG: hypothetical protein COU56_03785 [Candidatus Pacearchaeota archaeon CG10_big_fil_rev_8_21_14_0_10_31_9]